MANDSTKKYDVYISFYYTMAKLRIHRTTSDSGDLYDLETVSNSQIINCKCYCKYLMNYSQTYGLIGLKSKSGIVPYKILINDDTSFISTIPYSNTWSHDYIIENIYLFSTGKIEINEKNLTNLDNYTYMYAANYTSSNGTITGRLYVGVEGIMNYFSLTDNFQGFQAVLSSKDINAEYVPNNNSSGNAEPTEGFSLRLITGGQEYNGNIIVSTSTCIYSNKNMCEEFYKFGEFMDNKNVIINYYEDGVIPDPSVPNEEGGISEPEGGDGDFDNSSDLIPVPPLPTTLTAMTGFIKIYLPTLSQSYLLSRYMWDDDFISNLKDMYTNPMESIISLFTLPFQPTKDTVENIVIGNVTTTCQAAPLMFTAQYQELDFGKIYVKKFWGNYLDYSPNTKMILYLPYIGYKDIPIDEVMGKNIGVVYHVNVADGGFVAYITADSNVFAQYNGNMANELPLSNYDGSNIIKSMISTATGIGGMVFSGIQIPANPVAGVGGVIQSASSVVNSVMNAKPNINVDANLSGNSGFFNIRYPYYIITRPRQALPKLYNQLHGYPSFISSKLSDLSGYTEVSDIHLENMSCTKDEIIEIENLLKGGVIL